MEQTNKTAKKLTFASLIGRLLLIALAILIVVLVLVFIFDRYNAESFNSTKKVDDNFESLDEYASLKSEGFTFYGDYNTLINNYNCSTLDTEAKATYVAYIKKYLQSKNVYDYYTFKDSSLKEDGVYKKGITTEINTVIDNAKKLLSTAHYTEEVDYFASSYKDALTSVTKAAKTQLSVEEFFDTNFGYSTEDGVYVSYKTLANGSAGFTYNSNLLDFVKEYGFDGEQEDLDACLAEKKPADALADYGFDTEVQIYSDDESKLTISGIIYASFIYKDYVENEEDSMYVTATGYDPDVAATINYLKQELTTLTTDYITLVKAELPNWTNYYKTKLLGYEGEVNPAKDVITCDAEDGTSYYEFAFNSYTSAFRLSLKRKSDDAVIQTWYSNPETVDSTTTPELQRNEQSLFEIYYTIEKGQTSKFSSFDNCISDYNISNTAESLEPGFAFKYDAANNKMTVFYHLSKRAIDYTYFPKYISETKMNEYLERNAQLVSNGTLSAGLKESKVSGNNAYNFLTTATYKLVRVDEDANSEFTFNYYEYQGSMEQMSALTRNSLYTILYEWCGYTSEDLESDNNDFDQVVEYSKPEFEIAIEYQITSEGLQVTIPSSYIKETEDFTVAYIDVLPYFTATASGIEGYTVIPDGSGEILNHDNGNTAYTAYSRRVYSTDLTKSTYVNEGDFNDLMFPMYGVVNTASSDAPYAKYGLLAYSTSNQASLELNADITRGDHFNKNYYRVYLREYTEIVIGQAAYERTKMNKWTDDICAIDTVLNYKLLYGDELDYSDLAKEYREVLIDEYDIDTNVQKDTTTSPTLDLEVIGMYTYDDNFVGIQYTAKDTLTTVDQMETMISDLLGTGVKNINVSYLGWRNTGLVDTSFKRLKSSTLLGSRAKFKALLNKYNSESNVTIYPYLNFGEFVKYQESFGQSHYTAHGVDGSLAKRQPYDINSNIYDKTKDYIYALSPRYYLAFAEELAENLNKLTKDVSSVALRNLGNGLSGEYKRNKVTFKSDAMNAQIDALESLSSTLDGDIVLYEPYDYAFKYVTTAKEIPYQGTQYEILDYSVPFYQLVANGLFDYSGDSINANSEKGINEQLMRIIETGSNIAFTFTADSSEKLLQTDYNNYYYTQYTDWLEDVEYVYSTLDNLGIYECELTNHERVASNIYKVTYTSASKQIVIYINYTRSSYEAADGTIVPAKSYRVAA